jgi:hypothetical protein
MLFLTAEGSGTACAGRIAGLPAGLTVHGGVDRFPAAVACGHTDSCWVIEAECATPVLPSAEAVLCALASAYTEYQAAREIKIV